jgi:hypothetical protein
MEWNECGSESSVYSAHAACTVVNMDGELEV